MDGGVYAKYGGAVDVEEIEAHWKELRALVAEIRGELDDYAFSLNAYIYAMLESLSQSVNAFEAGSDGFERGLGELYSIVKHLRDNDDKAVEQHPLFPMAKEHAAQFPPSQSHLFMSRMIPRLFHQYARHAVDEYVTACEEKHARLMEEKGVPHKRERLVERVGVEKIDRLDELIMRHQIYISPGRVFMQGILDSMLMSVMTVFEITGEIQL